MAEHAATAEKITFSYSTPDQSLGRRSFIRAIETLGGQRRLARLYHRYVDGKEAYGDFYEAAIELLKLNVRYTRAQLDKVPCTGPVLFIANHPYGVIDGLVLIWLARQARPDIKVLTHQVLCQAPDARPHLLPIDFTTNPEAATNNIKSRQLALRALQSDGAVGIFPAGAVSASEEPWHGPAVDPAWHPFTAKLITMSKATVVPIYFAGQNSRIFQMASHLSYTWRLSLFFWETARRMGSTLDVAVGDPIPFDQLKGYDSRAALLHELRQRTYELAKACGDRQRTMPRFDQEYVFPSHFKF